MYIYILYIYIYIYIYIYRRFYLDNNGIINFEPHVNNIVMCPHDDVNIKLPLTYKIVGVLNVGELIDNNNNNSSLPATPSPSLCASIFYIYKLQTGGYQNGGYRGTVHISIGFACYEWGEIVLSFS